MKTINHKFGSVIGKLKCDPSQRRRETRVRLKKGKGSYTRKVKHKK